MSRTSKTLRRLSVPVLVTSVIMTGASSLGFAGVANAATTGTVTVTANTPFVHTTGNPAPDSSTITTTYTPADNTATPVQTITLKASGSAIFVETGTNTRTCTVAAQPSSATPPAAACTYSPGANTATVTDAVSEKVTVTATASPDTAATAGSTTVNVDGLHFTNCPQNAQNIPANCTTQAQSGQSKTLTVQYLQDGAGAGGVQITLSPSPAQTFPPQPGGTTASGANLVCTTDASGMCSFNVLNNVASTYTATTSAFTAPYPAGATAQEQVNYLANTTPARLDESASTILKPGAPIANVVPAQPGDAVKKTYTLFGGCTPASGFATCTGSALAGVAVTLTVDHGYFTPNCPTTYATCTFNPTPTAGAPVGNLASLTNSRAYTTDVNGQFVATLAIGRDAGFDDDGLVAASVSGVATGSSSTLQAGNPVNTGALGERLSTTDCNNPGANGTSGCATSQTWSTQNKPYNGGTIAWRSLDGSTISGTPNNVASTSSRLLVVDATDQFGNLTNLGGTGTTGVTVTQTGAGTLYRCAGTSTTNTPPAPTYSGTTSCNPGNVSGASTSSGGTFTNTFTNVVPSYTNAFNNSGAPYQDRFLATNTNSGNGTLGVQTDTATWAAPVSTFATYTPGSNPPTTAVATYAATTATKTAVVQFNFYDQNAQPTLTVAASPGTSVAVGTLVSISALAQDQFNQPIAGRPVQFIVTGPNVSSCSPTNQTTPTNSTGRAGFNFSCSSAGTANVNVLLTDNNGNVIASKSIAITFGSTTPPPPPPGAAPTFTINVGTIAIGQCATLRVFGPGQISVLVKGASAAGFTVIKTLTDTQSMAICPSTNSLYQVSNSNGLAPQRTLLVKAIQTLYVKRSGQNADYTGNVKPGVVGRSVVVFYYVDGGHVQYGGLGKTVSGGVFHFAGSVNQPGRVVHFFAQTYADKFNTAGRSRLIDVQY